MAKNPNKPNLTTIIVMSTVSAAMVASTIWLPIAAALLGSVCFVLMTTCLIIDRWDQSYIDAEGFLDD